MNEFFGQMTTNRSVTCKYKIDLKRIYKKCVFVMHINKFKVHDITFFYHNDNSKLLVLHPIFLLLSLNFRVRP